MVFVYNRKGEIMKFEIEYEVLVTRKAIIVADSEEKAIEKFHNDESEEDWEDYTTNQKIIEIKELD